MSATEAVMRTAEARVATERAGRYLAQLCKHFEHKLPVTLGEAAGRIDFPFGHCDLRAQGEMLVLTAVAADEAALDQVQDVIARHLLRFAFRDVLAVKWEPAA